MESKNCGGQLGAACVSAMAAVVEEVVFFERVDGGGGGAEGRDMRSRVWRRTIRKAAASDHQPPTVGDWIPPEVRWNDRPARSKPFWRR